MNKLSGLKRYGITLYLFFSSSLWNYAAADQLALYQTSTAQWHAKAEQGQPDAQFKLAKMYEQGQGVDENIAKAVYWYRKAALSGNAEAQLRLSWLYNQGEGVPEDERQSLEWLKKAAESGNRLAQYRLAWMYMDGGMPKQLKVAEGWFERAALQGNTDAQNALGHLYHHNAELEDYYKAAYWYLEAMNNQHLFAFGNMADLVRAVPKIKLLHPVTVHVEPSIDAVVMAKFNTGVTVYQLKKQGDWYAVLNKNRRVLGWVEAGML